MKVLLGLTTSYYPAFGGAEKSNRLLVEALAKRGHDCDVVASARQSREHYVAELRSRGVKPKAVNTDSVMFDYGGVEVCTVTSGHVPAHFKGRIGSFQPDILLLSTDDPAQILLRAALDAGHANIVYLARSTPALPFGPDCVFADADSAQRLAGVAAVVGVSEYVADYIRRHAGIAAVHVPISFFEGIEWPSLGRFDNEFVTIVNPCALKGISIFLALADAFPDMAFAAVPTWGTNTDDWMALTSRNNIHVLRQVDDINEILRRTRVLLVPSLWAEARGRIVVEAMLVGVPVIASNVGGIPEAKLGVPYSLPVNPISRYEKRLDDRLVPIADVPPQEIGPWREALHALVSDRVHYEAISSASRTTALGYVRQMSIEPFEAVLKSLFALLPGNEVAQAERSVRA